MGKSKQKQQLENAADISISCTPAPPKKQKAVKPDAAQLAPRTVANTCFATKASGANDASDQVDNENPSIEPIKLKIRPKQKQPPADPVLEPQDDSAATLPPTKGKKANAAQQPAAAVQDAAEAEVGPAPAPTPIQAPANNKKKKLALPKEPVAKVSIPESNKDEAPAPLSPPESRKSDRTKKPPGIAEKEQNTKDTQAVKKAKKVEAAMIVETPEETAAFLSRMKGDSQPALTSPAVTSPPHKRKAVDRTKVMEQLVNSHFPSPNPSVISGVSTSTGTDTRTSSIAPSDSVLQTNAKKSRL
ncbi:hypothetical protein FRC10_000754, partial [Ceratobasidium sp. 414]